MMKRSKETEKIKETGMKKKIKEKEKINKENR